MLINVVTKRRFKFLAVFIAVNMIVQIGFPTMAFALTSGPSQPEAGSFEPINTNQMVDLFSGDFTYNIPLLNVPGPNGGYPINLAYHAGIGMEEEASWVGLGWNVNAGVINRNLRGVPDDFNGDNITKTVHMKPQRRLSLGVGVDATNLETIGIEFTKGFIASAGANASLYYDNYKGVGLIAGIGLSTTSADLAGGTMQGTIGITSDSKEGLGFSPSMSYSTEIKNKAFQFELGTSMNSRQGLQNISFNASYKRLNPYKEILDFYGEMDALAMGVHKFSNPSRGTGVSFTSSSYVPMMDMPHGGFTGDFEMKFGADLFFTDWGPVYANVRYSENKILDNKIEFAGYGYLYSSNDVGYNIADFNREKDIPVNKNSKSLPIPSATYDVYSVKGQGVGGAFRTFRSDVGVFKDPKIASQSIGGGFGGEFDIGFPAPPVLFQYKIGINPKVTVSTQYSGPWQSHAENVTNYYKFEAPAVDDLFEPSYFKSLNEMVTSNALYGGTQNTNDLPFRFKMGTTWSGTSMVPTVRNLAEINNGPTSSINDQARTYTREKRVQSIQYLTSAEVGSSYSPLHSFTNTLGTPAAYADAAPHVEANHHLEEISVINPDGNRYIYNLPAYNLIQKDVMFSVAGAANPTERTRSYNSADNSTGNSEGMSNLYSATEMPPYAHSHMLTEVLSPDYVDLTGNGPTEDDLGYWVKFNYIKKVTPYNWRAPYKSYMGNNIENYLTNDQDDMSGFSYGEKEIIYLESIETKTHVAEYYLTEREDGLGVTNENGGKDINQELLRLDKIVLRSKADISKAIKTVHFSYDYSLCKNIPNQVSVGTGTDQGKLTLKKVWFTYFDNEMKGSLSPYEFDYAVNPDYDINQMDRWGNYQSEGPFTNVGLDQNYPYTNQHDDYTAGNAPYTTSRATDASAWNLTQVIMPSGGEMNINYESDDYAYVQNKKAMHMFKIIGTGNATDIINDDLSKNDDRIYFELNKPMDIAGLSRCTAGIEEAYFKVYMKLKNHHQQSGPAAQDFVEGYVPIFNGNIGLHNPSGGFSSQAWVEIDMVPPGQLIQTDIHPFKLAALRYLRFNRNDILSGQNTGLGAIGSLAAIATVFPTILSTIKDAMQMITGYYNYGIMAGWCDEIVIEDDHPSYLRLNSSDGVKYGGGCRVKSVDLIDNWSDLSGSSSSFESSTYGQVYDYTLEDGTTSSGVAEYEPLVGGEENPFREPIRYSSDRLIFKDNALMIEEPYNESLFPSGNVGYSRVTVRNRVQTDANTDKVMKAVSGITVNEFYTARDFPVYTDNTGVDHVNYDLTVPVPFIGSYSHHNHGYSQGFAIELNNMHGKPYSVSTYTMPINDTDPLIQIGAPGVEPIASTHYYYKTQENFVRNKSTGNKLDNTVTVLTADALKSSAEIGKHVDTYVDMRENKTTSNTVEILFNLNVNFVFFGFGVFVVLVPNGMPHMDNAGSMFRSVTTNKVITRNGILDKQVTTKEGARTLTENVYYDSETGSPLMTTTTNDFDQPIYDYTYAAHWEHEGMKGAYQNVGAIVSATSTIGRPGDEVIDFSSSNERYWIESINPLVLKDKDGLTPSPGSGPFKIARSGYRNQQSIPSGNIVSLSDPTGNRNYPLLTALNSYVAGNTVLIDGANSFSFTDCASGSLYNVDMRITTEEPLNEIRLLNVHCLHPTQGKIVFDPAIDLTDPNVFDVNTMVLTKFGNQVKAVDGNGNVIWGELVNLICINECIDDVLHASAARFSSSWNIDYLDAGVTGVAPNTTRYGAENIWRLHETYLFDINRKQSDLGINGDHETQTGVDGTYENFALFNWDPTSPNYLWTKTNTINQYSPYGFELENEDALSIKSTALYGYGNSVVTAVALNTAYKEVVFDGFEDYGGSGTDYTLPSSNYGHLQLTSSVGTPQLSTVESHTGKIALKMIAGESVSYTANVENAVNSQFNPNRTSSYYFSAWVKTDDIATLEIDVNSVNDLTMIASANTQKIEGWQRIEGKFTTTAVGDPVLVKITAGSSVVYLDDLRIQPFVSAMKTYVYDVKTLWIKAELDDRNYATIYNYDEEGNLVQIKKETKDGLKTIVSNRKNVKKNPSTP